MVELSVYMDIQPGRREAGPWISAQDCPIKDSVKGFAFGNTINIASQKLPPPIIVQAVNFDYDADS